MSFEQQVLPPLHPFLRRGLIFGLSLASTISATMVWADLLGQNGITGFDVVQITLFCLNFGWVSVFFWSSIMGWLRQLFNGRSVGLVYPTPLVQGQLAPELAEGKKTAIVVPVYNEDAAAVFARIVAMYQSLEALGQREAFHFFVLSDTTDPDVWVEEELMWEETQRRLGARGVLFYRRRLKNTARKAGNLADFCTRWGAHYEHMVVLDADSLLTGETLVFLARIGRLNPKAGIIQGLPSIIGSQSFFARAQQFAARLYGPILAAGINFWHLGDGNYWGHNAVIKTEFFTKFCGLPNLSGKPPFGGHIMSHDFVEAALIRRGGAQVWLVGEIEGCFEQMPQSIIENGKRERRWVQGNLQHSKILTAKGLHPLSRAHLFMGITSYLMPLMGLLFLLTGLASAIYANQVPPDYFPSYKTLFPYWPIFDGDLALSLLAIVLAMLTLPKILAALNVMVSPRRAKAWGGRFMLLVSVIIEHIFTIFIAPIMMLVQTSFVMDVLSGRDSGWGAQNRGDATTSWAEAWLRHRAHMLFGVLLAITSSLYAPTLFWWLTPIITGLVLAMPLSVYSSRASVGLACQKWGLMRIPEEITVPEVWTVAEKVEPELRALLRTTSSPLGNVERVLTEPTLNALHLALLPVNSAKLADADELAKARRKLGLWVQHAENLPKLSASEKIALLLDPQSLAQSPLGVPPRLP